MPRDRRFWYVGVGEEVAGPMTAAHVRKGVAEGKWSWVDFGWNPELGSYWTRLCLIAEFSDDLPRQPDPQLIAEIRQEVAAELAPEKPQAPRLAQWWIEVDGAKQGPLSLADIVNRRKKGSLSADVFAWRQGASEWLPVDEALKALIEEEAAFKAREAKEAQEAASRSIQTSAAAPAGSREISLELERAEDSQMRARRPGSTRAVPPERKTRDKPLRAAEGQTPTPEALRAAAAPGGSDSERVEVLLETPVAHEKDKPGVGRRSRARGRMIATVAFKYNNRISVGTCREISELGMMVLTHVNPGPPGTRLTLTVEPKEFKGGVPDFTVDAVVLEKVRRPEGFCVRFENPTSSVRRAIQSFLEVRVKPAEKKS